MAGVNFYALLHLRQLTALSTQLVSYHYPAIEGAMRLVSSLYAQLRNEKKYLAVRNGEFVTYFREESDEFRRLLATLQDGEMSGQAKDLLDDVDRLQHR